VIDSRAGRLDRRLCDLDRLEAADRDGLRRRHAIDLAGVEGEARSGHEALLRIAVFILGGVVSVEDDERGFLAAPDLAA
jgi:hypothetical protein